MDRTHDSLAMQKVVGSNPIIRSLSSLSSFLLSLLFSSVPGYRLPFWHSAARSTPPLAGGKMRQPRLGAKNSPFTRLP
jgi:hypothetical protein